MASTIDDAAIVDALSAIMGGALEQTRGRRPRQADRKAHQDFVTDIDLAVDRFLEGALSALLPDCPVLSEERAVAGTGAQESYWIVDPIDGTMNLMAGLPNFGICAALVDADGPRIACVASASDGAIYTAIRHGGARRNGEPLKLGAKRSDLVVVSSGLLDKLVSGAPERYFALRAVGKFRNFGAQSLHICGVADGAFAAAFSLEARIWDEVAGGLILREAGGIWRSAADRADWRVPAALFEVREQRSVCCHPELAARVENIFDFLPS